LALAACAMYTSTKDRQCKGLRLSQCPQLGDYNDGQEYRLATVLSALRFDRDGHSKVSEEGFQLLMRRDVQDVQVMEVTYDVHNLRDWAHSKGRPTQWNVLFHPWLFPDIQFREEGTQQVDVVVYGLHGVTVVPQCPGALKPAFVKLEQWVVMKDGIYMSMGPDVGRIAVSPTHPVAWFWSICVPPPGKIGVDDEPRPALVTKHILLMDTRTKIMHSLADAFTFSDVSVQGVLAHLQAVLTAQQQCTERLSRLMARCESAFEGMILGAFDDSEKKYEGATDPFECWEEQLGNLIRAANRGVEHAPLLDNILRSKVYFLLGKTRVAKGTAVGETIEAGARAWPPQSDEDIKPATNSERAKAIHVALISVISDIEGLVEAQNSLLTVSK